MVRKPARSDFKKYIDDNNALPADCLLGNITMSTISDGEFEGAKIASEFARLNLNEKFLPRGINPLDAWEKATKQIALRQYQITVGSKVYTAKILIRDVRRDAEQVIRHIVREVVDERQNKLLYGEVAQMVFYKAVSRNGVLVPDSHATRETITPEVTESERTIIEALLDEVRVAYYRYANFYDAQRVRSILRNYLLWLNAVQMKDGVYFVHSTRADELARLSEFINGWPGSVMLVIPILNIDSMRHQVIDTFQEEASKGFLGLLDEIKHVKATRINGVTQAAMDKLSAQYKQVMDKAHEYGRVLDVSQDVTAAAAELARDALIDLAAEVITSRK